MALFKISRGTAKNLPAALTEGYCWYTYDNSKFYIDFKDENGVLTRKALNAQEAEKLMGYDIATILNSSNVEIPTSKAVLDALSNKADKTHNHDDKYYTEAEIDSKLESKADKTHNHDGTYATAASQKTLSDTLSTHTGNADIHVTAANKTNWNTAHTHSQSTHARVDATKVADSTTNGNILINDAEVNVYSHPASGVSAGTYKSVTVNAQGHVTAGTNPTTLSGYGITDAETKTDASNKLTEAKTYADNAATKVKNDLLNGAGGAYDTLKELGELIDDNKDAIDALEDVASGKADKVHGHAISDVTNLQSALDGKAATSHGTHVTYSTTAPVMDGTASAGSATTVARSDHKHPTDTSRASQASLDTHTSNKTIHVTANNEANWNAAHTHSTSTHARVDATKVTDSTTNGNILINGAETTVYSHPNSGVTAGTYKSVTVNAQGHITAGSNPTTLAGYGITDAEAKGAAATALASAKTYTDTQTSLCAPLSLVVADDSSIADYSHLEDFMLNHAEVMVPYGPAVVNLVATLTDAFEPFNKTGTLFLTINKVDESCQYLIINATLHSEGEMPTQYVCSRTNGEWTSWDLAGNTKLDQHVADSNWKIIYDSGAINSKVNSFMGIDITGYKKLKIAVKCVNTTSSAGTSAVEVAFMGEGYMYYYFSNLFPSLITNSTSTSSAMAEFTMSDGFVFCDNVMKSATANNMFSSGEGLGVWNMTSLGGGIMTCNSPFYFMDVSAANDSMSHYFGAGSRLIVWGCK